MPLLKHPTADTIVDVTGARATVLKARGYTEVDADPAELARQAAAGTGPGAVQPQPPIDARPNPPAPPIEARPEDDVNDPPEDTRPANPLGPTADSVTEADGAGLDDTATGDEDEAPEPPAKSASRGAWADYAQARGIEVDGLTKQQIIAQVG